MMLAKSAKEMTEKAIEREIATRKERAEEFCESLNVQIERVCEERKSEMIIDNIPNGLYSYVLGICQDNGYVTKQLDNKTIKIHW